MSLTKKIAVIRDKLSNGQLKHGNFVRNVLTIATGSALSQAITIAALPLLSRLYSPAAFGLLATFIVLYDTCLQFACLGYHGSIVLPKRDQSAYTLWLACIGIGLVICTAAEFIFLAQGERIANLLGSPDLEPWLWLVPVAMLLWVGWETTSSWCARHKQFGYISTGMVANRSAATAAQLMMGTIPAMAGPSGLILGNVFGSLAGLLVLLGRGARNMPARYLKSLRLRRVIALLGHYRHFPSYALPSSFVAAATRASPVIFLGYFFDPAIVGFFAMANRLVAGPVQLLSSALIIVFYERANRAKIDGNLGELTAGLFDRLAALLMTPMVLLGIAAPNLVALLLGEQWIETGIYLQWLVIWLFCLASTSPFSRIFFILNRQKEIALINLARFLVSAGALVTGGLSGDATMAIAFFAIFSALVHLGEGQRVMAITGAPSKTILTAITKEFFLAMPFLVTMIAARYFIDNNLIVSGIFVALLALFAAFRLKEITRQGKQ